MIIFEILNIHELKHTNARLILLAGTNIKIISERLGHTDIKMTMNRYSHILYEMDKEAYENISNILFKQGSVLCQLALYFY
ncbi:tyrosine-type recombinase/integrase [Clostridioides difficile]